MDSGSDSEVLEMNFTGKKMIGENIYVFNTLAIVTRDLKKYLSDMGYSIFHVNDYVEIEQQLHYSQPDLILFELFSLNQEIIKLVENIKSFPGLDNIAKIAICHRNVKSLILLLEQVGFDEILVKPFDNSVLGQAIEKHIVPYLKINHLDEATVFLECQQKLDMSNVAKIEKYIEGLIKNNYRNIILDLNNVETLDSSGIGMLVVINKRLKKIGGTFRIANLNDRLKCIFSTLHIDKLLNIVEFNVSQNIEKKIPEPTVQLK